jgi:hypothetical protein
MKTTIPFLARTCMASLLFLPLATQGQEPEWWAHIAGQHSDLSTSMCKDNEGNIYVTGRISEGGSISGSPVSVSGAYDIYLAKFDATGTLQWVSTAGGGISWEPNGNESGGHVVFDSISHAIYLCGSYKSGSGPAVFGPGVELTGQGSFIARYDTDGVCQWARSASGGSLKTIGTDGSGDVYWYGIVLSPSFSATFHGPPNIVVPQGPCLAKYSSEGQLLWAKSIGHNIDGQITAHGDRIYFAGGTYSTGSVLLGEGIPHDATTGVAVLAALDTSSATNVLWRRVFHSPVHSNILDVAVVNDSLLMLAGVFRDSIFLPSDTLLGSATSTNLFHLALDSTGTLRFARSIETIEMSSGDMRLSCTADGSYYVGIKFNGTLVLPNTTLVPNSPWDMAIVHCDPEGEPMGTLQLGPVQLSGGMDVLATDNGGVLACGRFNETIDLGGDRVLTGSNDAFVVKYATVTSVPTLKAASSGELLIYANPNQGTCTIELPEDLLYETDLVLRILDAQGRVVQQSKLRMHEDRVQLDIRAQAKGTYVAEVLNGKKRYTGRIVFE